jgi:putative Mg2+ transporter-C (MgtC) family protein
MEKIVLGWEDFGLRLMVSLMIGALIGAEREYKSKSAGFRTMILISMGSCIFTMLSDLWNDTNGRIVANIVTGVGFLGGGVIFKEHNSVKGINSASVIWIVAALGVCCGMHQYILALTGAFFTLFVLLFFRRIQFFIDRHNHTRTYRIVLPAKKGLMKEFELAIEKCRMQREHMKQCHRNDVIEGNWLVTGSAKQHDQLVLELLKNEDIIELEF